MAKPTTQGPGGTGYARHEFALDALKPECAQKARFPEQAHA